MKLSGFLSSESNYRWYLLFSLILIGGISLYLLAVKISSNQPPISSSTALMDEIQISSSTRSAQLGTHVVADASGKFIVLWQSKSQDGSGWGIFARRHDEKGTPFGEEFQVNSKTEGDQFVARTAMDALGNFTIVWESKAIDGNDNGISCQRYNSEGVPIGSEFQVNTYTADSQQDPFIAMTPNGNFVVIWASNEQDGSNLGIYGQRFDANGTPLGTEFQVNTFTNGEQKQPSVVIDSQGNFTVVWDSDEKDGNGKGVFMRRYDANGNPLSEEIQVNSQTKSDQADASVHMNQKGDFVIVWASKEQDQNGFGIFAQRFNAKGEKQGAEFQVNTFTENDQNYPSAVMNSNGELMIVWESSEQDDSGKSVHGQRFDANGNKQGAEFQINSYTKKDQTIPITTLTPSGKFFTIWTSFGQDGSQEGVFGKFH